MALLVSVLTSKLWILFRSAEIIFLLVIGYCLRNGVGTIANLSAVFKDIADVCSIRKRIFDRVYLVVISKFIGANLINDGGIAL